MLIRTGFDIRFATEHPVSMIALLNVRPEKEASLLTPQVLHTEPRIALHQYRDLFDNVCTRMVLPPGETALTSDFVIEVSGEKDPVVPDAAAHPVSDLPDEVLPFLLGSRYCEVGKLADAAWAAAGSKVTGWEKVQSLVELAHHQIEFGYVHARSDRTAYDAFGDRAGVCRDFAHLAVTLCREVNIPARYCTGYLGDIGIDPMDSPMDFSAWFEAYIGGAWRTFDARHNKPRIGRIVMAVGRDAADTAITTSFGAAQLLKFHVHTDEVANSDLTRPPRETALPQTAI